MIPSLSLLEQSLIMRLWFTIESNQGKKTLSQEVIISFGK